MHKISQAVARRANTAVCAHFSRAISSKPHIISSPQNSCPIPTSSRSAASLLFSHARSFSVSQYVNQQKESVEQHDDSKYFGEHDPYFNPSASSSSSASSSAQSSSMGSDSDSYFNTNGYSHEHDELRLRVLENSLKHVLTLGWTHEALAKGAEEAGLPPIGHGVVSRGPVELVDYFIESNTKQMSERLSQIDLSELSTIEKIRLALRTRLELVAPFMPVLADACAIQARPENALHALKHVVLLSDEIWHIAGDQSTDFDWYVKRGVLGAIYTSTELYMLTDKSPGLNDTWAFLDRRLEDAQWISKKQVELGGLAHSAASLLSFVLPNKR